MSRPHFLQPLLRRAVASPVLLNTRSKRPVATSLETAFESADRKKGLLGRDGLAPGQAMVIAPTNLVHTFAMRFAIDILFMSRDGRVLKVSPDVPPRRIAGSLRAFAVIELAAGQAAASDTRPGDILEVAEGLADRPID
jgi:uncharacterized membrane protein (UPF0127 family)